MILAPILVLAFFLAGVLQNNSVLMNLSLGLLIAFVLTYWLINIIWAVISVISFNKEIEDENRRQFELWDRLNEIDLNQIVINVNQKSSKIDASGQETTVSSKPSLQEWAKKNPGRSINDYYSKFGR